MKSIKDVESGAKLIYTLSIKNEEECIELGMLAAFEAARGCQKTRIKHMNSLSKLLKLVPNLLTM